jgi:hypothetical protein
MASAAAAAPAPRITAYVTGDMVAVWTAEEATRLRVEHRVAGSPIGSLAGHTQQNIVSVCACACLACSPCCAPRTTKSVVVDCNAVLLAAIILDCERVVRRTGHSSCHGGLVAIR